MNVAKGTTKLFCQRDLVSLSDQNGIRSLIMIHKMDV